MEISIPLSSGDFGSQRKRYIEAFEGNLLKQLKLPSKNPLKTLGVLSLISFTAGFPTTIHRRFPSAIYWAQQELEKWIVNFLSGPAMETFATISFCE
jgi:hypothetical protein